MTENATVKLIMMLLPLQSKTGTNWLRTEQSKHYATGLCILYLQCSTNRGNHWKVNWSQGKAKVGDGEEVGRSTDSGWACMHWHGKPWTFLGWISGSSLFVLALYTIPKTCQTCRYSQIGTDMLFICHMSHHDYYGQPHMVDTDRGHA